MSTMSRWQYAGIACGGVISGVGFGINSTLGLFLKPICDAQGFGREVMSMSIALAMLLNGITSVFWGVLNDHFGALVTCCTGALLVSASLFLASYAESPTAFLITIPLQGAAGGAIAFGVTLGAVARLFKDHEVARRSRAIGLTSSLASFGVVVVPPVAQVGKVKRRGNRHHVNTYSHVNHLSQLLLGLYTGAHRWRPALRILALGALIMVPMSVVLSRAGTGSSKPRYKERSVVEVEEEGAKNEGDKNAEDSPDLHETLIAAQRHIPYILLVLGFFVCGFHVVFVSTHLPAYCEDQGLEPWVGGT